MSGLAEKVSKLLRMPTDYALRRSVSEMRKRYCRCSPGSWEKSLDERSFLQRVKSIDLEALHARLLSRPYPFRSFEVSVELLERWVPGEADRVVERAKAAMAGRIRLLGSDILCTGEIDWHRDYKSGLSWPVEYFTDIDPSDLDRPSDVKFPWELSRMHWMVPLAQAWQITRDDHYAIHVRKVLEHWINANPCSWGVNWAGMMEPAMRVFPLVWFYRVLADAPSWRDTDFRFRLLRTIYIHLRFVRQNLEFTDVNGNHLVAELSALVVGGSFFASGKPREWMMLGWRLLNREITSQVYADGVDYEGSVAYHRLVAECLFLAATAIEGDGASVPALYRDRLLKMAGYTVAYTRPDGLAPVFGDTDDARALPLGAQPINDHRYLPNLIYARWEPWRLTRDWQSSACECLWWWGEAPSVSRRPNPPCSKAFPHGGSYILRSADDYVFFDCGPLGLAGRGGHGHNDCLSFEAVLGGNSLAVDPGSYVYTADYELRNRFRSTAVHSTPQVAAEEMNRFISPRNLWFLHGDARSEVTVWRDDDEWALVQGRHTGYQRLSPSVKVVRTLVLSKRAHAMAWVDTLLPPSVHSLRIPLQLAPGVSVERRCGSGGDSPVCLSAGCASYILEWGPMGGWSMQVEGGSVAPSYGVMLSAERLVWARWPNATNELSVCIYPDDRPDVDLRRLLLGQIDPLVKRLC